VKCEVKISLPHFYSVSAQREGPHLHLLQSLSLGLGQSCDCRTATLGHTADSRNCCKWLHFRAEFISMSDALLKQKAIYISWVLTE